jgi:hypothetical protein
VTKKKIRCKGQLSKNICWHLRIQEPVILHEPQIKG